MTVFFYGIPVHAAAAAPDVHVSSCTVLSGASLIVPRSDDIGVAVRFTYHGGQPLSQIVWRVKYGSTSIDVFDDGTFSSDVRIDAFALAAQGSTHVNMATAAFNVALIATGHLPTPVNATSSTITLPLYISLPNPENCAIVRATYADGSVWVNPQLDQQQLMLLAPTPEPRAPNVRLMRMDGPVEVTRCGIDVEGAFPTLNVTFRPTPDAPADRIVFRAAYGTGALDFTDVNDFEPNDYTTHRLRGARVDPRIVQPYLSLDDPRDCTVVSVHYADGTAWQNPNVSAAPGALPTPVPDAMPMTFVARRWSERRGAATPPPAAQPSP
jgi:hypothetical protein